MKSFEFNLPERIVFGAGRLAEIGVVSSQFGKNAMLVCDPFCSKSGTAGKVLKSLAASGIGCTVYDEVVPNPTTDSIDKGAEIARREGSDFVIGLGGGSSIDTAKAVAVGATHPGGIWDYAIGKSAVTAKALPVVAVTTTSGTGSHCTCFSVITNPQTHQKPGMGSPFILPRACIVDPELMVSMPKGLTATCGFDVFSHAVEAYTSNAASPMSDMYSEKAILLVAQYLPTCYKDGGNIEARSMMALADTYSGIAICHAVVSLAHVIAHVISGHYPDIAHGDALFTVYKEVLKFNSKALPEKHKFISKTIGKSSSIAKSFDSFFGQFEFERRLAAKNPDAKMIRVIAEETFTYMKGIADLNPVPADEKVVRKILAKSICQ